ncbi:MAG: glycosyltransferase family 4 protein [Pirellulales bacterium]
MRNYGWSSGKQSLGLHWKLVRARGFAVSVLKLLFGSRRKQELVYFPANSGLGLYYDLLVAMVARFRGYRIAVHHHVYAYIDKYDWRMALLNRLVGREGTHVVYCEKMEQDFLSRYPSVASFPWVPPTIVSQQLLATDERKREHPTTIGCLSNLSIAKGLPIVLKTFERVHSRHNNVRLILAGPCMGAEEQKLITTAQKQWPDNVEYRGPAYGDDKAKFYSDIDVFLFPTQYKNESWGIVLTEALSTACPTIAYDRGCVSYIIHDGCGKVVAQDGDFVAEASDLIEQWILDQSLFHAACVQALERYRELDQEAVEQLPRFVEQITN